MTRDEQMWEAVEQKHGELSRREAFVTLTAMDWADKTMIDEFVAKLHKLKCGYENDLDAEPRVYERDIQLCAKISLIERLILELKEESL